MIELIREYPWGSFFIILATLSVIQKIVVTIINRNRPQALHCECCCDEDDCGTCDADSDVGDYNESSHKSSK